MALHRKFSLSKNNNESHGLTAGWKKHNIILTDPSTPLDDAHHGGTFLLDI